MALRSVTANSTGTILKRMLHGREHYVVPLSMLVPGVLHGSKGPLLYPQSEVLKNPQAWNGMPIVVDHPTSNGLGVSARSPDVIENQGIGWVYNANTTRGKLDAEGWIDIEKTRLIDPRIIQAIEKGQPVELSTGLFTDNFKQSGVHTDGRDYSYVARNYKPDHLAVFVDKKGACSIDDGCGLLMNKDLLHEKIKLIANEFNESKIKRADDGKFGSKSGSEKSDKDKSGSEANKKAVDEFIAGGMKKKKKKSSSTKKASKKTSAAPKTKKTDFQGGSKGPAASGPAKVIDQLGKDNSGQATLKIQQGDGSIVEIPNPHYKGDGKVAGRTMTKNEARVLIDNMSDAQRRWFFANLGGKGKGGKSGGGKSGGGKSKVPQAAGGGKDKPTTLDNTRAMATKLTKLYKDPGFSVKNGEIVHPHFSKSEIASKVKTAGGIKDSLVKKFFGKDKARESGPQSEARDSYQKKVDKLKSGDKLPTLGDNIDKVNAVIDRQLAAEKKAAAAKTKLDAATKAKAEVIATKPKVEKSVSGTGVNLEKKEIHRVGDKVVGEVIEGRVSQGPQSFSLDKTFKVRSAGQPTRSFGSLASAKAHMKELLSKYLKDTLTSNNTLQDDHVGSSVVSNHRRANMAKFTKEEREEIITSLVSNCSCETTANADREVFGKLSDQALARFVLNTEGDEKKEDEDKSASKSGASSQEENQKAAEEGYKEAKPVTNEQWLATAPPEIQSVVRNAIQAEKVKKTELVKQIVANSRNIFSEKQLMSKPLDELQAIASLAQETEATRIPSYLGASGVVTNVGKVKVEPLMLPTMNFSAEDE